MSAGQPSEAELKAIQTTAGDIFALLTKLPYPAHAANSLCIANVLVLEKAAEASTDKAGLARTVSSEMGEAIFNMWSARNVKA